MQRNAFLHPAAVLAIIAIALFLGPSVAQPHEAASVIFADSPVRTRILIGPRPHHLRVRDVGGDSKTQVEAAVAPDNGAVTDEREGQAPLSAAIAVLPKSHLEIMLDQSGIDAGKRPLAAAVFGLLDPACQEKLETFRVLYDHPAHRGLAGRGVIIVSGTVPDQEFIGLLLHEGLGHFRDITCVTGTEGSTPSAFRDGDDPVAHDDPSAAFYRISWQNERTRKPHARRSDFVTGYAFETDSFEDLAESVTYFVTQEAAFRSRAAGNRVLAAKLQWLETFMPKKEAIAEGTAWDGKIAWDATKLTFTWTGNDHTASIAP